MSGFRKISTDLWIKYEEEASKVRFLLSYDFDQYRGQKKSERDYSRMSGLSRDVIRRLRREYHAHTEGEKGPTKGQPESHQTPTNSQPTSQTQALASVEDSRSGEDGHNQVATKEPPETNQRPTAYLETETEKNLLLCPLHFPTAEREQLERWASQPKKLREWSGSPDLDHAIKTVHEWATVNGHGEKRKLSSWVRTVQNAINAGWALRVVTDDPTPSQPEAPAATTATLGSRYPAEQFQGFVSLLTDSQYEAMASPAGNGFAAQLKPSDVADWHCWAWCRTKLASAPQGQEQAWLDRAWGWATDGSNPDQVKRAAQWVDTVRASHFKLRLLDRPEVTDDDLPDIELEIN